MVIRSFKKIQANKMVISPKIEEVTDAYWGFSKEPAEKTHHNAIPSAQPIAISHGIAGRFGQ